MQSNKELDCVHRAVSKARKYWRENEDDDEEKANARALDLITSLFSDCEVAKALPSLTPLVPLWIIMEKRQKGKMDAPTLL